jgi:hypothetical protein
MKRLILASVTLIVASLTMVASASAETTTTICVPEASSKPVLSTNTKGECPTKGTKVPVKYKSVQLPGTGGLETLNKILSDITYVESGVAGKPTIRLSGVNVQVVNGEGRTDTTNGEGNLVIGYDEDTGFERLTQQPGVQTGSHNLILGEEQEFTSYGGIVGGLASSVRGRFSSVTGGDENIASGVDSSVSGGRGNKATEFLATVSGGTFNEAGAAGSVGGGSSNKAGELAWVGGGYANHAAALFSSIFGGKELIANGEYEAIP